MTDSGGAHLFFFRIVFSLFFWDIFVSTYRNVFHEELASHAVFAT